MTPVCTGVPVAALREATKSRTPPGKRNRATWASPGARSSDSEISRPRFRKASCSKRSASTANEYSVVSRREASGRKVTVVPLPLAGPAAVGRVTATPRAYSWTRRTPSRRTSAVRRLDKAFATASPIPKKDMAAEQRPTGLDLTDRSVNRASRPGPSPASAAPNGMPGPSSATRTAPSATRVTPTEPVRPVSASSTARAVTSKTSWCSPRAPVEPMYIPGLIRTASAPSSTRMRLASYVIASSLTRSPRWCPADGPSLGESKEKARSGPVCRGCGGAGGRLPEPARPGGAHHARIAAAGPPRPRTTPFRRPRGT